MNKQSTYHAQIQSYIEQLNPDLQAIRQDMVQRIQEHRLYIPAPASVKDSFQFGWMRGKAFEIETLVRGRWLGWLDISETGQYVAGKHQLPSLDLCPLQISPVPKMLKSCMNSHLTYGVDGLKLLDWIGYGLGISYFEKPNISQELWSYWYEQFDISLFFLYPADYLSDFLLEYGHQSGNLDFYPTPSSLSSLIQKLLGAAGNTIDIDSYFEPCSGAGSLLLECSNINMVATDLSRTMVKATAVQAFLYMPYLLYVPQPILDIHVDTHHKRINKYFEFDTDTRIYHGDSLLGEYTAPTNIFMEDASMVDIYVKPLDYEKNTALLAQLKYHNRKWESLSPTERFDVVKAQARHIPFDKIGTNPPFSNNAKHTLEKIKQIEQSNELFLEMYDRLIQDHAGDLTISAEDQLNEELQRAL